MAVEVRLRGFDHVRQVLRVLPERVQNNVMRGAVAAIAKDTGGEVSARAPVDEGVLAENIAHQRRRGQRGQVKASVMVRMAGKLAPFYWRFLEFGTVKLAKQPFIRPVFDALATRLNAVIAKYLPARVERELRKLAGGRGR